MLVNDPDAAHYEIDPARLDLAAEFRRAPRGPHSDELQRVLHRMRWQSPGGRHALVAVEPGRRWMLARIPAHRDEPLETFPNTVFTDIAEAEWLVFRLRWRELTGQDLPEDLGT
jgi:hypothetical protein